jgi:hypothetical protein
LVASPCKSFSLDLVEEVRLQSFQALFVRSYIEKPQRCGDAAQQRVSILRREAHRDDLPFSSQSDALSHDHRLVVSQKGLFLVPFRHQLHVCFIRARAMPADFSYFSSELPACHRSIAKKRCDNRKSGKKFAIFSPRGF